MNTPTLGGLYLRFQMISFWGLGGGLQFFSTCPVKCADKWIYFEPTNKCYKYFSTGRSPTILQPQTQKCSKLKIFSMPKIQDLVTITECKIIFLKFLFLDG